MSANAAPRRYSGVVDSFSAHQTNGTSAPLLMCQRTWLPPQQFSRKLSQSAPEEEREREREEAELVSLHSEYTDVGAYSGSCFVVGPRMAVCVLNVGVLQSCTVREG